ncbi:MAG: hypothetical protein BroJett018_07450 [Chloroflexota bacterium]|nr:hypothetical protein [Chloroflexota bacterium]GIK62951.1 MAG: hypothetical protein BroJett018_07450 [Chloroflexota bacterium]
MAMVSCQPTPQFTVPPTIAPTETLPILRSYATPITLKTATPALPAGYEDAAYLLDGVCYDALRVLVGTPIILRVQADLDQYFINLNSLGICEETLAAPTFDFSSQILVGQIQVGQGCDANFYPDSPTIDAQARTVTIRVQFTVAPDCDYEVMGIFLMAIARPPDDYTVRIQP